MVTFKCKMCGGTVEVKDGEKHGICDSCGTLQPLPTESNADNASGNTTEEWKRNLQNVLNTGTKMINSTVDSVSKQMSDAMSDSEKTKYIVLGIVFLFVFWPVSIWFFVKAFEKKNGNEEEKKQ